MSCTSPPGCGRGGLSIDKLEVGSQKLEVRNTRLRELPRVQVGVESVARDELGVSSAIDDPAVINDQDLIGLENRGQPVSDDDGGAALEGAFERRLDRRLGS